MIAVLYILVPLVILAPGLMTKGHTVSLFIAGLVVVGSMVRARAIRYFFYLAAGHQVIIRLLYLFSILPGQSANIATNTLICFILAGAIYISIARSDTSEQLVFNCICISALLQATLGLFQSLGFDPFNMALGLVFKTITARLVSTAVTGSLFNTNFLAAYLAISLPFFFRKGWYYGIPLLAWHLLTMEVTGAVMAALVGVMVYFRQARYVVGAFAIGLAFTIWGENGGNSTILNSPRYGWWMQVLEKIFESPYAIIAGHGPAAMTGLKFPIHNEWLELWFHYGIAGVGLFGWYVYDMRREDRLLYAALAAAAVNSLANYPLHLAPSAFLILIIMGLLERSRHGRLSNIQRSSDRNQTGN